MSELAKPADILRRAVRMLLPPESISGSAWAEKYHVLSSEDSGAPGAWDLRARPYQTEILDVSVDTDHEFVTLLGPAQFGKTLIGLNFLGWIMHINPAATMVVHPTVVSAQKYSKTRFAPFVRDVPQLASLMSPEKSRDSGNTILEKSGPGFVILNVGSNAPAGLASAPVKYLMFEELDRVPIDVTAGEEGDFEALATARTTDANLIKVRKIYRSSTPTILGASRIQRAWLESDQRYWHFDCPHCDFSQRPRWESVIYDDAAPLDATYQCDKGCTILEPELRRALRQGKWIATRPEIKGHAGFWVHGLMVRSMAYIVAEFIEARKGGSIRLQTWKNVTLGELWNTREGEEAKVEGLLKRSRAEKYSSGMVPDGVCILTAGVDVQTSNPQRVEVLVRGTGVGYEQWTIKHEVISGNLATAEPWDRLEAFLLQEWVRDDGEVMKIRAVAVDTGGHFRGEAVKFRKRKLMQGLVYPIKGASAYQRNIAVRAKTKYALYMIDTVQIKDHVYGNLTIETPGPRYQHFPNDLDQVHFDQLLGERPVHTAGKRGYEPYPKGRAVEILDTTVYADAALHISGPWSLEDLAAHYTKKAEAKKPKAKKPTVEDQVVTETAAESTESDTTALPLTAKERYLLKVRGANPGQSSGPIEQVFDHLPLI